MNRRIVLTPASSIQVKPTPSGDAALRKVEKSLKAREHPAPKPKPKKR